MDMESTVERRGRILTLLCLNMALQMIVCKINQDNQAVMKNINNFMVITKFLAEVKSRVLFHDRSLWRVQRSSPFMAQILLSAHSKKEFSQRLRVKRTTFYHICSLVAPLMQKSNKGGGIPLENRVGVSLSRLGTSNYLLGCADLFGMSEGAACIVVQDFCKAVLKCICPLVVPRYSKEALPATAKKFEAKHNLPFIMGAIDGSHIPIIAPVGDPAPFYNQKGFYSVLLQGIVDMDTIFWDWDFGWAGSLHDYTVFVNSREGLKTLAGDYLSYKLIGDVAYPYCVCMYVPFKGTKDQLEPEKAHWNFIQSSTCMCVERAFGVLKGRWRILLRQNEMKLENLADAVGACICLHNLCILHKDFVDEGLLEEAKQWLRTQNISKFGDLQDTGLMQIFEYSNSKINRGTLNAEDLVQSASLSVDRNFAGLETETSGGVSALQNGGTMHRQLAKAQFKRHLREQVPLPQILHDNSSSNNEIDA